MNEILACLVQCLYLSMGAAALEHPETYRNVSYDYVLPYDRKQIENPYITHAVGWSADVSRRWRFDLQIGHESSLATRRDWGQNYVRASVYYFPFRRM